MIAKDILLFNIYKIHSGIIITLQSIIFYFVIGSSEEGKKKTERKKKEDERNKEKERMKEIVSHVLHMCRVKCESLLCDGVPNHYIFSEGLKPTVE